MCAIADRSLSSEVGVRGIFRKVLIFVMVGAGHILDTQVIGSGDALRMAVIFLYISNEGVSLLGNAAHIGLLVPERLKRCWHNSMIGRWRTVNRKGQKKLSVRFPYSGRACQQCGWTFDVALYTACHCPHRGAQTKGLHNTYCRHLGSRTLLQCWRPESLTGHTRYGYCRTASSSRPESGAGRPTYMGSGSCLILSCPPPRL